MYPTLPFGPLSLPTSPLLALLSVILCLDVAGRFGKRLGIHPDHVWNTGLVALAAGLIVARLWNVFQFWNIYRSEPILIFSLRPSGFELWPGLIAALVAGYAYLIYAALDPPRIAAALSVGALAGSAVLAISGHMTGDILGTPSSAPWALPYFGETRHPVGLYRAFAYLIWCAVVWVTADVTRPGRTILLTGLGYSLIRLLFDAFVEDASLFGSVRTSQVVALVMSLLIILALAYLEQRHKTVQISAEQAS